MIWRVAFGEALLSVLLAAMAASADEAESDRVREIGSRWELFVDDDLIDQLTGARQVLHRPSAREVAIVHDEPWEGNACLYHTVFQDGDLYRMTDYTDTGLIVSRDGHRFHVWPEAFMRPGIQTGNRWVYGSKYTAWGIVETDSELAGAPRELSFYTSDEGYWRDHVVMRRYALRIDGFVSITAPLAGGQCTTKALVFEGNRLLLNFSTSAAGGVLVEIQDESGQVIEGFALADCPDIYGDAIGREVQWKGGPDLGRLAGKPVRLLFELRDADLYAFRFAE